MSTEYSLGNLTGQVRDLVEAVSKQSGSAGATSEKDKEEVSEWIAKVSTGDVAKEEALKDLDSTLISRTYLVGNQFTIADAALYGALYPVLSKASPLTYYSVPSVTRYFDHIQNVSPVRTAASALSFAIIPFDIDNAPKVVRQVEQPKKKAKKETATPAAAGTLTDAPTAAESLPADTPSGKKDKKVDDKGKKEKGKKEATAAASTGDGGKKAAGSNKAAAPDPESSDPVPSMIDLRVGHIIDVKKHPDADGLYVEQIDIGEETGPRTVVSGLVNYIPIEQMRDKYLIAVCNLKPANMRGVKSFAMVLCATSKEGKEGGIEIIQPPAGSKPGERVYFEGEKYENGTPLAQLNPKKKIFEIVQPGFITLESREAAWVDATTGSVHRIRTKDGICVAPTLVGASLS